MKYKVICLLFVFILINLNNALAFFQHNDHSDEIRIDHTINDPSTQDNNIFYLYDNFFSSHADSYLSKKKDGFISVDQVKIDIPLKILTRNAIYPENSIDRMMLANLRVKKLMLEYEELQKKTRLMLQENSIEGTRKTDKIQNPNKAKDRIDDIEAEKEEIDKKFANINRLSELNQNVDSLQEIIAIENPSILEKETKFLPKNISDSSEASAAQKMNSGVNETDVNTGRQNFTRKENSELPWVFTLFLKILNYIMTNRIEIILYMIFVAVAGYFISLQVRR